MTSLDQSNYEHIAPDFRHVMSRSDEARLHFIDEPRWLGYPSASNVISHLLAMMNLPKRPRMPNLLLVAESNNGKTHILNHFFDLHGQTYVNDMNKPETPILMIQAPPGPVEKDLMIKILDVYSAPYLFSDPVVKLRHQAIYYMRHSNVRILIIDEAHSMLSGSSMSQRQVMTSIKYLCNELMIPIVCAGTNSAAKIIVQDQQHASRFDPITLDRWKLDPAFQQLVMSFESVLPLKIRSNLHRVEPVTALHDLSKGNIGNLHKILRNCAKHAIQSGTELIDIETIRMFPPNYEDIGQIARRG